MRPESIEACCITLCICWQRVLNVCWEGHWPADLLSFLSVVCRVSSVFNETDSSTVQLKDLSSTQRVLRRIHNSYICSFSRRCLLDIAENSLRQDLLPQREQHSLSSLSSQHRDDVKTDDSPYRLAMFNQSLLAQFACDEYLNILSSGTSDQATSLLSKYDGLFEGLLK